MGTLTQLQVILGEDTTYDISNQTEYIHVQNDGFGLPPVDYSTQSGPLQEGASVTGFKIKPRQVRLLLNTLADTISNYWLRRSELLYIFSPREEPMRLRFIRDGIYRDLYCYYTGGMNMDSQSKQAWNGHRIAVELTAFDPLFYDNVPEQAGLNEAGSTNIAYNGTYTSFPIVSIIGPITNLVITNTLTGDKLSFNGATIDTGETITVDTRYGYKTVKDQTGANRMELLNSTSDLATFSLTPLPLAPEGVNTFSCTSINGDTETTITMEYRARYIGV